MIRQDPKSRQRESVITPHLLCYIFIDQPNSPEDNLMIFMTIIKNTLKLILPYNYRYIQKLLT